MDERTQQILQKIGKQLNKLEPAEEYGVAKAIVQSLYKRNGLAPIDPLYISILSAMEALEVSYLFLNELRRDPSILEGLEAPNNQDGETVIGTNGENIEEVLSRLINFIKAEDE